MEEMRTLTKKDRFLVRDIETVKKKLEMLELKYIISEIKIHCEGFIAECRR